VFTLPLFLLRSPADFSAAANATRLLSFCCLLTTTRCRCWFFCLPGPPGGRACCWTCSGLLGGRGCVRSASGRLCATLRRTAACASLPACRLVPPFYRVVCSGRCRRVCCRVRSFVRLLGCLLTPPPYVLCAASMRHWLVGTTFVLPLPVPLVPHTAALCTALATYGCVLPVWAPAGRDRFALLLRHRAACRFPARRQVRFCRCCTLPATLLLRITACVVPCAAVLHAGYAAGCRSLHRHSRTGSSAVSCRHALPFFIFTAFGHNTLPHASDLPLLLPAVLFAAGGWFFVTTTLTAAHRHSCDLPAVNTALSLCFRLPCYTALRFRCCATACYAPFWFVGSGSPPPGVGIGSVCCTGWWCSPPRTLHGPAAW